MNKLLFGAGRRFAALLLALLLTCMFLCSAALSEQAAVEAEDGIALWGDIIIEYGEPYDTRDEVALYLHVFRELPPNYITKEEAYDLGWKSSGRDLWDVAYGCSIGGDRFGNREGALPDGDWYECDLYYDGGSRNAYRLVFSSAGMICYTEDHYATFETIFDAWYEDDPYMGEGAW